MSEERRASQFFVRNMEAENLLEMFLVSAISTFLLIRFYLQIAGYPQLTSGPLHIAHVLWGGFFMLAALVLVLGFLGGSVQRFAAVLGGAGFGAFIDELGKFITSDHNYFFQPTVALVYIIFILLYLVFRYMSRFQSLSGQESLVNALELMKESVLHRMDEEEKRRLVRLIANANSTHPVKQALASVVAELLAAKQKQNLYEKGRAFVHDFYTKLVQTPWFSKAVILVFIGNSFVAIAQALLVLWRTRGFSLAWNFSDISFFEVGELISSAVAGLLAVAGIIQMRRSRLAAYHFFRSAVLVSIFLTNVLLFFREELGALVGLAGNIVLLGILDYVIREEGAITKDIPYEKLQQSRG